VCYAFTLITIDPKHRKQNRGGFHHFPSSRDHHGNALQMSKPLVLPATVVFDAASRPTGLRAEPFELRPFGHDAHAPSRAAVANHVQGLPYLAFLPI
jgi:hypothetical protein